MQQATTVLFTLFPETMALVYADDTILHLAGQSEEDVFETLKDQLQEALSLTEDGTEGKSKKEISNGSRRKLMTFCEQERVGMSDSIEYLSID